jgi:hypothetical protein
MNTTNIERRKVLGALAGCGLTAIAGASAIAQAPAAPGPILVENDRVRVYGVVAKPGQGVFGVRSPGSPPRLAVFMRNGKVKFSRNGEAPKVVAYKLGDMVWDTGDVTFAENADGKELSVYLVEPKGKPLTGGANPHWRVTPLEVGGKIVLENDYVRVIEHASRPRMGVCGEGMHSHLDHLTIGLADGRIKITKPGKEPMIVEAKAGDVFWDPSGPHAILNVGSRNMRALLVEIKSA